VLDEAGGRGRVESDVEQWKAGLEAGGTRRRRNGKRAKAIERWNGCLRGEGSEG
jgi:hypothetical protein